MENHKHVTSGLLSPIMLGTLFELPVSVSKYLVRVVYAAMKTALSMMHELDLIHCDLKPQNIFRDSNGHYHLADYDGCVQKGQKVSLSTRRFWPHDMKQHENTTAGGLIADRAVDFAMLAATLLFLADKWDCLGPRQPTLAQMKATAQLMLSNAEPGAEEILECLAQINNSFDTPITYTVIFCE